MFIYIIIASVFLIILFILIEREKCIQIDNLNIKIKEALLEIKILLEKKMDLLSKLSKKTNELCNTKAPNEISKIKNKKLEIFELEEKLYKLKAELIETIEDNNLEFKDEDKNLIKLLNNNDLEIKALKLYYNKEAYEYNSTITKFKYFITRLFKKCKKLETFVIKKEIEFEILKQTENDNR